MSTIITSPNAPAALGPYSHAVLSGDTLYTSGQIALIPETAPWPETPSRSRQSKSFGTWRPFCLRQV